MITPFKRPGGGEGLDARIAGLSRGRSRVDGDAPAETADTSAAAVAPKTAPGAPMEEHLAVAREELIARLGAEIKPQRRKMLSRSDLTKLVSGAVQAYFVRHAIEANPLSRRDLGKAQESARQFHIRLAFDSAETLCRSPEVDAVFIATPNACHLQDVLVAASCGKPILCEKPMAMNADECRQMVEAARSAKVLLGIAQVFRFEDSTAWFREHVAAGNIGQTVFARSEFSFRVDRTHPRRWINDPEVAGGGPVADVGVHCIDALRFIL